MSDRIKGKNLSRYLITQWHMTTNIGCKKLLSDEHIYKHVLVNIAGIEYQFINNSMRI